MWNWRASQGFFDALLRYSLRLVFFSFFFLFLFKSDRVVLLYPVMMELCIISLQIGIDPRQNWTNRPEYVKRI